MGVFHGNNGLFASKTLTKVLISYFIIILISISTISVMLYYKFSSATIEDIRANMQDRLAQNMNQLELIRNQVNALGLQLINDSVLVDAMYWDEADEVAKYLAARKLMQVKDANPMIHSVYVYNSKTGQFISNFGTSAKDSDEAMELLAQKYNQLTYFQFIPRAYSKKTNKGEVVEDKIISFIFSDSTQAYLQKTMDENTKMDSSIIINLNAEYIQKSFTVLDYSQNSAMFLLSRNGDVICDSDFKSFGRNIAGEENIAAVLLAEEKSGYMTVKDPTGQSLITYYASGTIPFLFLNKSNYGILLEKVFALRLTIITTCVLISLLCILIAVLSAYNVYLPFGKLVRNVKWQLASEGDARTELKPYNEIEYLTKTFSTIIRKSTELETSIQENFPLLKKMFLRGLLEGDMASVGDISKKIKEIKFGDDPGRIRVLLFTIDGYWKLSGLESDLARYNVKAKIESLIEAAVAREFETELVDLKGEFIASVVQVKNEDRFMEIITGQLSDLQGNILETLGISVTAVIGMPADRLENIHLSYSNCLELMKYRFVYGYGSVLDNNMIQINVNRKYTSIEKEKKKLIQAIKACDSEGMETEINEIVNLITDNQYDYIRLTINQLALDITKAVEANLNSEEYEIDFSNIYSNLNFIDTLEEVKEWFLLYCSGIIQKLEGKKDNRQKEMIRTVLSYLENNYHNCELSAEMLAEMVNLTPGYFGKLFSEHIEKSVNEYIIELRMRKAVALLESNSDSINDIAARVGYLNQSYFTAIFKKNYGKTPNQYRIDYRNAGNLKK